MKWVKGWPILLLPDFPFGARLSSMTRADHNGPLLNRREKTLPCQLLRSHLRKGSRKEAFLSKASWYFISCDTPQAIINIDFTAQRGIVGWGERFQSKCVISFQCAFYILPVIKMWAFYTGDKTPEQVEAHGVPILDRSHPVEFVVMMEMHCICAVQSASH